jgi:hypothetical protein
VLSTASVRGNTHGISAGLLFQLGETLMSRLSLDYREGRVREPLVDRIGHLGNVATAASLDVVGFVYATETSLVGVDCGDATATSADVVDFVYATAAAVGEVDFVFATSTSVGVVDCFFASSTA